MTVSTLNHFHTFYDTSINFVIAATHNHVEKGLINGQHNIFFIKWNHRQSQGSMKLSLVLQEQLTMKSNQNNHAIDIESCSHTKKLNENTLSGLLSNHGDRFKT